MKVFYSILVECGRGDKSGIKTQTHLCPLDGGNVTVHKRPEREAAAEEDSENWTTRHLCVLLIIMLE